MTTAQFIYATIAAIGLSLGWRVCFGWWRWWLAPIVAGAALWAAMLPAAAQEALADTVTQVRDGDTIVVGKYTAIRLQGVHAPEFDEQGGYEVQRFMAQLVAGERVECRLTGERSYDREIGTCYIDGRDIGAALIAALHRPAARPRGEGHRRHVKTTGEVCLHDEKIDRMAFRKPSNPKSRAIRWLPRECSSLNG